MENVLIFTPFWKRPEIVELYVSGINRLRAYYPNIDLFCMVSPEDPNVKSIVRMLKPLDATIVSVQNDPLGAKKNAGLKWVLKNMEFDYLMELNSDGVINPELMDIYSRHMAKKVPMFGMKNIYFLNWNTKEAYFVVDYAGGMSYGSARMYRREYLQDHLWPDTANCGLDTASRNLMKSIGVQETVVDTGDHPMVLDIKTDVNIFPWEMVVAGDIRLTRTQVNFNDIAHYFGMNVYEDWILELQDYDGFSDYFIKMAGTGLTYKEAYEATEGTYQHYYGRRKYKNYDSFKMTRARNEKG